MAFRDLDEFLTAEPLVLPVKGKDYEFPGEISAKSWLLVQRLGAVADAARKAGEDFDPNEEVLNDVDQTSLMSEIFGGVDEELSADGVGSAAMNHIFFTLMIFHLQDRDAAEVYWNSAGETPGPNRAERRAPKKKSTPSQGSQGGSTAKAKKKKPAAKRG